MGWPSVSTVTSKFQHAPPPSATAPLRDGNEHRPGTRCSKRSRPTAGKVSERQSVSHIQVGADPSCLNFRIQRPVQDFKRRDPAIDGARSILGIDSPDSPPAKLVGALALAYTAVCG